MGHPRWQRLRERKSTPQTENFTHLAQIFHEISVFLDKFKARQPLFSEFLGAPLIRKQL